MDYPEMLGKIIDTIYMTALDSIFIPNEVKADEMASKYELITKIQKQCIYDYRDKLFANIVSLYYPNLKTNPDGIKKLVDQIIRDND